MKQLRIPMALKIAAMSSVLILFALIIVGLISYERILSGSIEPLLGKRLDFTARGVAVRLADAPLLELQKTIEADLPKGKSISFTQLMSNPKFRDIHRILTLAQRQNELESNIQVLVRDPSNADSLRLLLTSAEEQDVWKREPIDNYSNSVLQEGLPIYTPIFKRAESRWISGLSPIESEKGELLGILRIDYRADREIKSAAVDLLKSILFAGLFAFLASTAAALYAGNRLSKPLRHLSHAAAEVGQGNLEPRISVESRDEIGDLSQSFKTMLGEIRASREKLEEYNRDLEKKVSERTAELSDASAKISAMIDSLDEGFFMFSSDGICLPFFSRACLSLVERDPSNQSIETVLRKKPGAMREWLEMIFAEQIPFSGIADIGPKKYQHSEGRYVNLNYRAVRDESEKIKYVVVLAQDITARINAEKAAESERQFSKLIVTLVENREHFLNFVQESKLGLEEAQEELRVSGMNARAGVLRALHTLKGGAGLFNLVEVQNSAHQIESSLVENSQASVAEMHRLLTGVMQLFQASVAKYSKILALDAFGDERVISTKERDVLKLRDNLSALRLSPEILDDFDRTLLYQRIDQAFSHFNLVIRQSAEKVDKLVDDLHFVNGDLKLYHSPLRPLFSACVHAFRNAVDHGLEGPGERMENGKPESGRIEVAFDILNNPKEYAIELRDDGRGVNEEAVRKKLREVDSSHPLLESEYDQLIQVLFESGFSTKEQVTELSGRGVGMDAIRFEAERLGGRAWISSRPGKGSTVHIRIPSGSRI